MNESETRAELIDLALREAGWGTLEGSRVRREYPITDGRIIPGIGRAKAKQADYLLYYKNQPLAVIEAKQATSGPTEGVTQAKEYAGMLELAYTYSTNGKEI